LAVGAPENQAIEVRLDMRESGEDQFFSYRDRGNSLSRGPYFGKEREAWGRAVKRRTRSTAGCKRK
jgi:hypothetical protein